MDDNYQILWKRLDTHGLEECMTFQIDDQQVLYGKSMFFEGDRICNLNYRVRCDLSWCTQSANIKGYIDEKELRIEVKKSDSAWNINGSDEKSLHGCSEIDLGFTPSTNLMSIKQMIDRDLNELKVSAAWLRFPEMQFEPMKQHYKRLSENIFSYESSTGLKKELKVNRFGFVVDYPGFWTSISDE